MGRSMALASGSVFIFHEGRVYPVLEGWAQRNPRSILASVILKLANHVQNGRTVRGRQFMESVAREAFPQFQPDRMLTVGEAALLPQTDWRAVSEIVLIWPDANGMGWAPIERQIFRNAAPGARVLVVNGRRRRIELTRNSWRSMRWRRFLEKSLVVELAFTVAFLFITPALI